MKICPRLVIFELLDCTLRTCRGYDFSIFLILIFLDRYFGISDSDLRASPPPPPVCLVMECHPRDTKRQETAKKRSRRGINKVGRGRNKAGRGRNKVGRGRNKLGRGRKGQVQVENDQVGPS